MKKLVGIKSNAIQCTGFVFAPYIPITTLVLPLKLKGYVNGEPVFIKLEK